MPLDGTDMSRKLFLNGRDTSDPTSITRLAILLLLLALMVIVNGCDLFLFHPSKVFLANSTVQKADPKDIFL